ncbi:MAG: hypothetical protein ABL907_04855 [Hyphomicrobium sp.]
MEDEVEGEAKSLKTKTLPQYMESEDMMARFLVAAHHANDTEITKTEYTKGLRSVRGSELQLDALNHFLADEAQNRDEFYEELKKLVGTTRADEFCHLIAQAWYDGSKRRHGGEMLSIRASIHGYLKEMYGLTPTEDLSTALLTPLELAHVLQLTWRLLQTSVEDWVSKFNKDGYTSGNVLFRRGLVLDTLFGNDHAYAEPSVLSSWSLSVTLAEQFTNTIEPDKKPAIVHADFYLFQRRVLFFSPFIPGMDSHQLEACVIPSGKTQRLHFQGVHRGVGEYLLDYPEELL